MLFHVSITTTQTRSVQRKQYFFLGPFATFVRPLIVTYMLIHRSSCPSAGCEFDKEDYELRNRKVP